MSRQNQLSNSERLIQDFNACQQAGVVHRFSVGKGTGNGPSVVAALRRRGYVVELCNRNGNVYEMSAPVQQ